MIINNIHTFTQRKESSSLTDKPLLFIRRPDIDAATRLKLGIAGLGPCYRDYTIADLELRYNVSHTFIYTQSKILREGFERLYGSPQNEELSVLEEVLRCMRFFIEGKVETRSALHGLSNFGSSLGVKYSSTNFISEVLTIAGSVVDSTHRSARPLLVTFLCDEIYSGGQAILVTIEAQSMAVLDIRLAEGNLSSADWEASLERMSDNNVRPEAVIKDQGKAMQAAMAKLPEGTLIGADTFHGLSFRLGRYRSQLERKVNTCQEQEVGRATCFIKAKSYEFALKIEGEWEAAKYETLQALDRLEWFDQYYFKMIQQLRPFTSQGIPRDKAKATSIIRECIEALSLLELPKLQKHLTHIETLLDNGQLLHYMDKCTELHEELQDVLEPQTSWLWMLYWQHHKKTYQSRSPKVQQNAKQQALAAQELLQEYYQQKAPNTNTFESLKEQVFTTLDQIVQASSLVETFNSILKPFINSSRGQVSQELLNLVKFYHNHRIFKRGKRKNKAPIELLTGKNLEQSWIDLLMDKIKAAFIQHDTHSVKELLQGLSPKKEIQQQQANRLKTHENSRRLA